MGKWMQRVWNRLRRRQVEHEIDEEIRFHLALRIEDNLAAGLSPVEARRDALRRFGSRLAAAEAIRDTDFGTLVDSVAQDLRFAARSLARRPAFTAVALLTLAVGIGANTAIFTIVRSVLLRPLPFPQPERLVSLDYAPRGVPYSLYQGLDDHDYLGFREQARGFDGIASFTSVPLTLTGAGEAVRVTAAAVTGDFFRVLGVPPAAGRGFDAADIDRREPLCVVSDSLWRGRLGADPAVLRGHLVLGGVPHAVVGIMPPGFAYPSDTEVWTPLTIDLSPNLTFARPVIARLAPGTTQAQAVADLDTYFRSTNGPAAVDDGRAAQVVPLQDAVVGDAGGPLLVFTGAVTFVLLIALANVANLVLMRAASRRHEIVTRLALGASRGRLFRLLLTEGALLSFGGSLLGVALALFGTGPLLASLPPDKLPRAGEVHADAAVLLFAVGLAAMTTLAVSLVPILQSLREDLAGVSRDSVRTQTGRRHRLRHGLVVAELALALVLLVGAGLLSRSFLSLRAVDPGFESSRVLIMTLDLPPTRYAEAPAIQQLHARLREGLAALPGVQSAGAVNWLPLARALMRGDIAVEGGAPLPSDYTVAKTAVSPGYFETMRMPLRGRDFADADDDRAPGVAVVSESVSRRLWPEGSAIGRRLSLRTNPGPDDWLTVVGVVGDVRQDDLASPVMPAVYRPLRQVPQTGLLTHMTFAVRTAGDPAVVAPAVRSLLARLDPDLAPQSLTSMDAVLAGTIAEPRFQSTLIGGFSLVALALAALGVYGVLAASVAERQHEIGIRMALGADAPSVVRLVVRRTLSLAGAGVLLGALGAAGLTRVLSSLLVGVGTTDGAVFAAAAIVLVTVALLAAVVPARRASRIDPLAALRAL